MAHRHVWFCLLTFVLSGRERILTYILEKLLLTYIFGCDQSNLLTFIFCRGHLLTSKNRLRRRSSDDLLTYILDTNFYFCSRKPRCYWLLLTYGFKMIYWLIVYPWEKYLLTSVLFSFCSTTPNARQAIYKASRSKRVVKEWETANHFHFSYYWKRTHRVIYNIILSMSTFGTITIYCSDNPIFSSLKSEHWALQYHININGAGRRLRYGYRNSVLYITISACLFRTMAS